MSDPHRVLKEAIRANHGCDSYWLKSVPVGERFEGKPIWQETVEVFALNRHSKASIVYAWSYEESGQTKTVTPSKRQ